MGAGQSITKLGSYLFTSTIMIMIKKTEIKMSLLHRGGALRDDTKNGCVADYLKGEF